MYQPKNESAQIRTHDCPALYDQKQRCFYTSGLCTYDDNTLCVLSRRSAVPHADRVRRAVELRQQEHLDDVIL